MIAKVKNFYETYPDRIFDKRYNSPYWLRSYTHRQIYDQFLPYLKPGMQVLDAGCGEGVLSCLIAQQGIDVVGMDLSAPNIEAAGRLASQWNVKPKFLQGDAENLPFSDNSFDVVISSHVLEHLPDLHQGLRELYRVTRNVALIAMPTCLNPACWVLLGGDRYWKLGRRSLMAMPIGLSKTIVAWLSGKEGPDEGYAGNNELPHIWRFPWVMRQQIESVGFQIEKFEAGPLIFPYLTQYIPPLQSVQIAIDTYRDRPLLHNFGYGSMAVCYKKSISDSSSKF